MQFATGYIINSLKNKFLGKYHIRFSEKRHGKSYYLAFSKYGELGEHTFRDEKSQYIFMEPAFEPSQAKTWHLVNVGNNEYQLVFEENGKKYHLSAQTYYPADRRDQISVYVCAHHESHQGNLKWHLHQEGGHVRITMAQHEYGLHGFELNCHEFYRHSDMMRKTQGQRFDQTLHHSDDFWNCMVHQERQHHHWVLEPADMPVMQIAKEAIHLTGKAFEEMMGIFMPGGHIPTGKYYISVKVHVPEKPQPYYLALSQEGELGQLTKRDINSQYIFADNQMHKATIWEVTHHSDNNHYTIKTEHQGRTYHLCAHDFYPADKRDAFSKYVAAHTMSSTENMHWHIKEKKHQEYEILCAGKSFNLHGWRLCCQGYYQFDKVYSQQMQRCDYLQEYKDHAFNCTVHSDANQKGILWKFTPAHHQQHPHPHPHHQPYPEYPIVQPHHENHQGILAPGKYYIKLHGKHQFMTMQTEGEIGQCSFRDQNSTYVILEPYKNQIWEVERSHEHTYKIRCHHKGKHYYLCCHSFYPHDDRDVNSKYALAHTDANSQNSRWHIRHKHAGFEICQAENNFNLQEWSLGAHTFYEFTQVASGSMKKCDFVLQTSNEYINCIVHKNKSEPSLVWEFEPIHESKPQYPGQQPPFMQQQPGYEPFPYPGQQPPYPGQQQPFYPGQQQQYPGQQFPQYPQYPGQQQPQYPGQQQPQYPGQFPQYPPYPGQQF